MPSRPHGTHQAHIAPASIHPALLQSSPDLVSSSALHHQDTTTTSPRQTGHSLAVTTSSIPAQHPPAAALQNLFDWCKAMGHISPDIALPPKTQVRCRNSLGPFLRLRPIRHPTLSPNTSIKWHPDKRPSSYVNWYSLFCQATGVPPPRPCEKCATGKGLWSECIVPSTAQTDRKVWGACASCMYNAQGATCSFYRRVGRATVQAALGAPAVPGPAPSASLPPAITGQVAEGHRPTSTGTGDRGDTLDEMNQLFEELAEAEREMEEAVAHRANIESRLLVCEGWLDSQTTRWAAQ
ncbi:hypothetical protein CONLIGDRAFT_638092 [Coniochaeta ligniaria NRRL 30616]|uniref:Uncharacterized protein n=1 Tax=Coniochaeta ligniaria NRRL 30616 TaxID=1408157 RepID=A0A1J7IZ22_9PEZI|nr:hypothetical protein CONLIGDRAFT_638092 [Coniochaeta ligniaria NRRL 30616]